MLAKRVIPCLDVKDGRVVKGTNFVNLRDAGDPVEVAKEYDRQGADELVFLDITASHERRKIFIDCVTKTAENIFLPLTVGGGLSTVEDVRMVLRAGCDKVSINTAAVKTPRFVQECAKVFGSQCTVVAIDAKKKPGGGWEVYTHGGRVPTGIDAVEWARRVTDLGAGEILLTSMDCDGTKSGYDVELTAAVSKAVSCPVIASGGAGSLDDMSDVILRGKADAVLAASIFHYGTYTVADVKKHLTSKGILVRI